MATPKATNDHISTKNTKFSRKEFIHPNSHETHRLDQIMTTFPRKTRNSPDRNLFGHITAKSVDLTKNCTNFVYFQVSKTHSHAPSDKKSSASQISANPSRSNGSTIMELPDTTSGVPLVLARSVKIRPGSNLEVLLECTRQLTDQMDIRIDTGFHHKNPNIYIPPCCINNPNNKHNPRYMPLTIFNLSTVDHLYIGKDTVIIFAEQPVLETYNIELASEDKIEEHLAKPRNWVPQKHKTLPEIPHDTAFLCSPADVPGPRKVQLQDKDITTDIRQKFEELCDEYGEAFSKNNEDIGRTKLVKMDINTGDSPPISSRLYTLPLKHYEWVQREIESLEWAGVITKSMSKWASPIVVVPKKSAPVEPPKRTLCVDFRKVNELQQEVITAGKTKGQISIHPLQKNDEMYAKLKGAKVFSTIDLRSGYHHIALGKTQELRPHL